MNTTGEDRCGWMWGMKVIYVCTEYCAIQTISHQAEGVEAEGVEWQ